MKDWEEMQTNNLLTEENNTVQFLLLITFTFTKKGAVRYIDRQIDSESCHQKGVQKTSASLDRASEAETTVDKSIHKMNKQACS